MTRTRSPAMVVPICLLAAFVLNTLVGPARGASPSGLFPTPTVTPPASPPPVTPSAPPPPAMHTDPDDTSTPVDLRDQWWGGNRDYHYAGHTADTYDAWTAQDIAEFALAVDVDGDDQADFRIVASPRHHTAGIYRADGTYAGRASWSRSNRFENGMHLEFDPRDIGRPSSYRFYAAAWHDTDNDGQRSLSEVDRAPDSGWLTQELTPAETPTVTPGPSPDETPAGTPSATVTPGPDPTAGCLLWVRNPVTWEILICLRV